MISWLASLFRREPEEPDSDFPGDLECPDTQPTAPGLLDSLEDAMKTAVLAVVILTLTGCATLKGVEISDDERAACEAQTCTVWTKVELEMLVREAMKRGYLAGRQSL